MIYPAINKLVKKAGNRYSLTVAVAKRARELVDGDKPLLELPTTKPVSIAVNEIHQGKTIIGDEAELRRPQTDIAAEFAKYGVTPEDFSNARR